MNAQEELRPKDEYHIFQPKLVAGGMDDQAIFCKRAALGAHNDLEERLMALLYRHHVEFAVGHGISVHAEVSKAASDRATSIETVIVPYHEVPRTAPPTEKDANENPAFGKLAGLVLDMKVLAEADAKTLPKQLGPLVSAYHDWIDREEAKLHDPEEGLAQFGDPPIREPGEIRGECARKLRTVQVSDHFRAILGCLLGEDWTTPRLVEMVITPDGHVLGRCDGQPSFSAFIGAPDDLIRNIHGVAKVAELDGDEIGYLVAGIAEIKRQT